MLKYQNSFSLKPVNPSFKNSALSTSLPKSPVAFANVLQDIDLKILPNSINWGHPMFFAYFPSSSSWSAIQGEILGKSLQSIPFTKELSTAAILIL